MSSFWSFIRDNYKMLFRAFLFLLTVVAILLMYPRQGKFKYEFQKGKPWQHETIFAEFDFPVYKSDEQINQEKDSVLNNVKPYFQYDSTVAEQELALFNTYVEEEKEDLLSSINIDSVSNYDRYKEVTEKINAYEEYIHTVLTRIYNKGILGAPELSQNYPNSEQIVILKGKLAESRKRGNVYTQKQAYEFILDKVQDYWEEKNESSLAIHLKRFNLYDFIEPNLFFNQTTTENVKQSALESISLTKGLVQAGERIISKGELVDAQTYRILESLKREHENKLGTGYFSQVIFLGQIIFVFACIGVLFLFLWNFRNDILQNSLKTSFILINVLLIISIAILTIHFNVDGLYIVPFALLPIIIRTFYDARLALFIHIIVLFLVGFLAPNGFEFVFLNFITGIVAIFSLTNVHRRGKLFVSSVMIILAYSFVYFGLAINQEGNIANLRWIYFLYFAVNGMLVLLSYPLIYLFEKIFGFLSDVTLMELADTNQPLLRQLAEKAPGTFQHSLQVANLAEESIYKVGGSPLLVRTGALYHDIGKMNNPAYFIENQSKGFNPHEKHEFDESANIIVSHVEDGIELARKHKLPEQIIDFIRTHHGTTKVQYFYQNYLKKHPDEKVDLSKFTYPGPRPFSIETAVLMMADSVEAASRSLSEHDEDSIAKLVDGIIDNQMKEGQFDLVDLTFRQITTIKEVFKQKLGNIYHVRVKYPDQE